MRIGKDTKELASDFDMIHRTVKQGIRQFNVEPLQIQKADYIVNHWKESVYQKICNKTGEIKNMLTFNTSLHTFIIKHEFSGSEIKDDLVEFCEKNGLKFDIDFVRQNQNKLADMPSLTISIGLEFAFSKLNTIDVTVTYNSIKHFNKENLERVLEGNCEKDNLSIWYDAHTPIPIDFGFALNPKSQSNEFSLGFYVFDGSARTNLKRTMSAFQSYGADFTSEQVSLLKRIPSEELRVYFYINEGGVARIVLMIENLKDDLAELMAAEFTKSNNIKKWSRLLESLEQTHLQYYLEYSVDGYQFGCQCQIGKEFGSIIYLEDI